MSDAGMVTRLAPLVTDDTAPFWDAATRGELVIQRCCGCATFHHPPRPMCPHCHSIDHEWVRATGRGVVYSFSLLHYPQHPAFTYPVIAALVDLDEGVRLVSNIVDVEPSEVTIGMLVSVTFAPTAGDRAVPVFRPRKPDE